MLDFYLVKMQQCVVLMQKLIEGHKGQNLVFSTKMLLKAKIQTQYTNIKEFIKAGLLI